jgi:hypothetical protein
MDDELHIFRLVLNQYIFTMIFSDIQSTCAGGLRTQVLVSAFEGYFAAKHTIRVGSTIFRQASFFFCSSGVVILATVWIHDLPFLMGDSIYPFSISSESSTPQFSIV